MTAQSQEPIAAELSGVHTSRLDRWRHILFRVALTIRDLPDLLRGLTALLVGFARRDRMLELWLGDSNSLGQNRSMTSAKLTVGAEGQVIWHLGPRLMYTVARTGLPPRAVRAARLTRRWVRPERIVLFHSAGEIDCRCHLVPRLHDGTLDLGYVREYVDQVCTFAEEFGAAIVAFLVQSPQSGAIPDVGIFPIQGDLADRVRVSEMLRARLTEEVAARRGKVTALVVDPTDLLSLPDGSMDPSLASDGVHTNAEGIRRVRSRVRELGLADRLRELGVRTSTR